MEIMEIIKDSLMFPANNIMALVLYIIITLVLGVLIGGVAVCSIMAFDQSFYAIFAAILFIIALVMGFILAGYEIDIIKSGIDMEDEAPGFDWKNDIIRGIKAIIVTIIYFIIPAVITVIVALLTNVPGHIVNIGEHVAEAVANTNGTVVASSTVEMIPSDVMAGFIGSISITILVAIILFVIFSFIQYMANARLANTDSLAEALDIPEAFRDLQRIGFVKVFAVVLLMLIINAVINGILSAIAQQVPQIAILSIIVTPFMMFATNRANGLVYSDIA